MAHKSENSAWPTAIVGGGLIIALSAIFLSDYFEGAGEAAAATTEDGPDPKNTTRRATVAGPGGAAVAEEVGPNDPTVIERFQTAILNSLDGFQTKEEVAEFFAALKERFADNEAALKTIAAAEAEAEATFTEAESQDSANETPVEDASDTDKDDCGCEAKDEEAVEKPKTCVDLKEPIETEVRGSCHGAIQMFIDHGKDLVAELKSMDLTEAQMRDFFPEGSVNDRLVEAVLEKDITSTATTISIETGFYDPSADQAGGNGKESRLIPKGAKFITAPDGSLSYVEPGKEPELIQECGEDAQKLSGTMMDTRPCGEETVKSCPVPEPEPTPEPKPEPKPEPVKPTPPPTPVVTELLPAPEPEPEPSIICPGQKGVIISEGLERALIENKDAIFTYLISDTGAKMPIVISEDLISQSDINEALRAIPQPNGVDAYGRPARILYVQQIGPDGCLETPRCITWVDNGDGIVEPHEKKNGLVELIYTDRATGQRTVTRIMNAELWAEILKGNHPNLKVQLTR